MTGTDSLNVERLKDADPQGPREAMDILERAARTARDAGPVRDGGAPAPHAPTALIYRPAHGARICTRLTRLDETSLHAHVSLQADASWRSSSAG